MYKLFGYLAVVGTVFFLDSASARSCATSCAHGISNAVLKKIGETPIGSTVEWMGQTWTVDHAGGNPKQLIPPMISRLWQGENNNDRLVCHYDVHQAGKYEHFIGRVIISIDFCSEMIK